MSDDEAQDPRSQARAEARQFLHEFLVGMQGLEESNRLLAQAINTQVQQAQTQIQQAALGVSQVNAVLQRTDMLVEQIAVLAQQVNTLAVLMSQQEVVDPYAPPALPPPQHLQPRVPSAGQALGGLLGFGLDQLTGGRNGGGGRRRR